jgi:hypothetical protein
MYTRNELVEETVRQMALALDAHQRERVAAAAPSIPPMTAWLEKQLGHAPSAATLAAAVGLDVEDILDLRLAPKPVTLAAAA